MRVQLLRRIWDAIAIAVWVVTVLYAASIWVGVVP
jgi:hypothetical protein